MSSQQFISKKNKQINYLSDSSDQTTTESMEKLSKTQRRKMNKLSNNQSSPSSNDRKKKTKKRNKRKNQRNQSREEQLLKLKQDRQESLVSFGNHLMENLNAKYCNYFAEDMREVWEQTIIEFVGIYEDIDPSLLQDDEFLNEKKTEMRESWQEILILIKEDYDADQQERHKQRLQQERERKMRELGIIPGTTSGGHNHKQSMRSKSRRKREEKQKLRAMRQRLAEMDQIAVKQEKKQHIKHQGKKQKNRNLNQTKVTKKPEYDDWDESDSSSDEGQGGDGNGQKINMATSLNARSNFDAFADSDDEAQSAPAEEHKPVRKTSPIPKDEEKEEKQYEPVKDQRERPKTKKNKLRSPICVVMGHVDAGKTKILDCIRGTNVQNKESGGHGITQQIGATNLSIDYIKQRTSRLSEHVDKLRYKIPGLLFLDTPGHAAFSNLRSRGSSLCDIAVLVVDITEGLMPQTIESLNILKQQSCPVIVALNKIDLCLDWKPDSDANTPFLSTYKHQAKHTKRHFENRLRDIIVQFAEQGLNAQLWTKNKRKDLNDGDISIVPTSATTGEGIPDLLYLIVQLTKKYMESKISLDTTDFEASVLEVKETTGYGHTIDIIVSNGTLRRDDTIIICGMNGPIITKIRALLLPKEAQEMRMKQAKYTKVDSITASMGVRIAAVENLSGAVAGAPLFIVPRNVKSNKRKKIIEKLSNKVQESVNDLLAKVDKHGGGVFVQASTLGSLEALIEFLTSENIPVSGVGIGTISKRIISKASTLGSKQPEYAAILAFDVKIAEDARILAMKEGIEIFESDVIYHLQQEYEQYIHKIKIERQKKFLPIFPVEMKILSNTKQHIMHKKNPLILGVKITRGTLRMNIPICAKRYDKSTNIAANPLYLGKIIGIRLQDRDVDNAGLNDIVSIKIMNDGEQNNIECGKSFIWTDPLISEITRESIDILKDHFEQELKQDRDTIPHLIQLKKYFNII